ncbi:MAG: FAD-dependent oxidoreductase [Kouleothrix sp.]
MASSRGLRVDAVFADIGLLPNSGIARRLAQVDPDGFILVDDKNATTQPGLFAAGGDATTAFGENTLTRIPLAARRAAASAYEHSWHTRASLRPEGAD